MDEAGLRTAVGRAYYAAFLVARAKTGQTGSDDIHSRVINALRRGPAWVLGGKLDSLRRLRTAADYEMSAGDWEVAWGRADALATDLLGKL